VSQGNTDVPQGHRTTGAGEEEEKETGRENKTMTVGAPKQVNPISDPTVVYDPSRNVLDLVEAAVKRLDDLQNEMVNRLREAQNAEIRRIDGLLVLRADYQDKLVIAESKRIDAIRAVDVGAVAIASERAAQQATVLANQVSASAETLRALVASTAQQVANSLSQIQAQLTERIALLEKSQYEIKGRSGMSDPITEELVKEMRLSRADRAEHAGKKDGMSSIVGYILAAVAALSSGIAIVLALQGAFRTAIAP
jgi:hypothetical protein